VTRLALGLLWLLHLLPLPLLAPLGRSLGLAFYAVGRSRRRIALTNLRLCFPEMAERDRRRLARAHFQAAGRSLLERTLLWWSRPERIRRVVQVQGVQRVPRDRPVIFLVPHFVGLDMAGARIAMDFDCVSIYSRQKNALIDRLLLHGRRRFGDQLLLSRQEGMAKAARALRHGRPFFYLPDMDYGARDAIFVPFFGVPAATITGLARLARVANAAVVSCIARLLPGAQGYVVELSEPWRDFPSEDVAADTRRMNAAIEDWVRTMPEQYLWMHRRFKTRPPGEARLY
jgi:Kdo2-lipid IVA lauroyltransferase/acyltransferase